MTDKSTKEFGITEYMRNFEKSLNYMVAVLLAICVTAICCKYQGKSFKELLDGPLHDLYHEPKIVFFSVVAVLPTLPYYFYYTLRDNVEWNMGNREREKRGLVKLFILYEIGVMSIFYLLMQSDKSFAGTKMVVSVINLVLLALYTGMIIKGVKAKEKHKKESPGYFAIIIIVSILIFLILFVHSAETLIKSKVPQDWSLMCLMSLFIINAGINIYFLTRYESGEEIGIISNRVKVMIPVISASTYVVSVFYCFYAPKGSLIKMITVACVITIYEIILCWIKKYKNKIRKAVCCITFFIAFVSSIPIIIWVSYKNQSNAKELMLKWFILIGVSIYMDAIKYWGCIVKYLKKFEISDNPPQKTQENSEEKLHETSKKRLQETPERIDVKIKEMMTWLHNSILGSMLFLTILIVLYGHYFLFLFVILACSFMLEHFIYANILNKKAAGYIKKVDKIYNGGRIIEFIAIIVPIIFFVIDILHDYFANIGNYIQVLEYPELVIVIIGALALAVSVYIEHKWSDKEPELEEVKSKWKELSTSLWQGIICIRKIAMQALKGDSTNKFFASLALWGVYVILSILCLQLVPSMQLFGYTIVGVIVLFDWFLLFKNLIDYYMRKMKMAINIKKFQDIFEEIWKNCLDELEDFGEREAEQFKIGNRLRPILFFMGSSFNQYSNLTETDYQNIAKAACSLELIHKSSVIFDDYIDKDSLRHGTNTFHEQYNNNINTLILIGNTMLAKAQTNFAECKNDFRCDESTTIENMKTVAQIIIDLCTGCHKELAMPNYERKKLEEIDRIIYLETVSLIKNSMCLGYDCFHEEQPSEIHTQIEALGEAFGYIFQYLNDLEPFSQETLYKEHKGGQEKFDYQKKNIALWTLYNEASADDKKVFTESAGDYKTIIQLYKKYDVESKILTKVKERIKNISDILHMVDAGNKDWIEAFQQLFDQALCVKGWDGKNLSL